jgi:hypothetical protein
MKDPLIAYRRAGITDDMVQMQDDLGIEPGTYLVRRGIDFSMFATPGWPFASGMVTNPPYRGRLADYQRQARITSWVDDYRRQATLGFCSRMFADALAEELRLLEDIYHATPNLGLKLWAWWQIRKLKRRMSRW